MSTVQKISQTLVVPVIWLFCLYLLLLEQSYYLSIIWTATGVWYITCGVSLDWKKIMGENVGY